MTPPFGIRPEDSDMQVQEVAADVAQLLRQPIFINQDERWRCHLLAAIENMHTEALPTRLLMQRRVFQLAKLPSGNTSAVEFFLASATSAPSGAQQLGAYAIFTAIVAAAVGQTVVHIRTLRSVSADVPALASRFQQHHEGAPEILPNTFGTSESHIELMLTLGETIIKIKMCSDAKYEVLNVDTKLGRCVVMIYGGKCTSAPGMLRSIMMDSVSHAVLTDTQQEVTEMCLTAKYELRAAKMKSGRCDMMPRACASDGAVSGYAMLLLRYSTRTYTPDQGETITMRLSEADTDDHALDLMWSIDRERRDDHALTLAVCAQMRADNERGVPGHLHAFQPSRASKLMSVLASMCVCDDSLSVSITPDQGESCRASMPEHHMQIIFTGTNGSSLNADSITPDLGENWLSALTAAYNGSVTSSATRVQPFVAMLSAAMPRPENKLNRHRSLNSARNVCWRGDLIAALALVAMPTRGNYGSACTVPEGLPMRNVTTVSLCEALRHDHDSSMRAQLTSICSWVFRGGTMLNVAAYVDIRVILPRAEPCREWHDLVSACASWEPGPDISISLAISSCTQPASTCSLQWNSNKSDLQNACLIWQVAWLEYPGSVMRDTGRQVHAKFSGVDTLVSSTRQLAWLLANELNSDVGYPASVPRHNCASVVDCGAESMAPTVARAGKLITVLLSLRGSVRPAMRLHTDLSGYAVRLTHSGDERDGLTAAAMLVMLCQVPVLALPSWLPALPIRASCVYRDYLSAGEALIEGARQSTQLEVNNTTMMISAREADACNGGDCHSAPRVQSLVRDFVAEESVCALRVPIRIRGAGKAGDAGDHDVSLQDEEPKWLSDAWHLVEMFDLLSTSKGTVRRRRSEHIAAYKNPWLVRKQDKRVLSVTRTIQRDQKLHDKQSSDTRANGGGEVVNAELQALHDRCHEVYENVRDHLYQHGSNDAQPGSTPTLEKAEAGVPGPGNAQLRESHGGVSLGLNDATHGGVSYGESTEEVLASLDDCCTLDLFNTRCSSLPGKPAVNALDCSLNRSLESSRGNTVLENSTGKNAQSFVEIPALQATSHVVTILTDIVLSLVDDMVLTDEQADEMLLGATVAMVMPDSVAASEFAWRVRLMTGVTISPSDMLKQTLKSICDLGVNNHDEPNWLREAHDLPASAGSMPMMMARYDSASESPGDHSLASTEKGLKETRDLLPASSDSTPDSIARDESVSKVASDHPGESPSPLADGESTAARKRAKRRGGAGSDQRRRDKHRSSMDGSQCNESAHQGEVRPSLQCSLMVTKDGYVQAIIRPTTSKAMHAVHLVLFTADMYGTYRVFMSKHSLFQVGSMAGERLSESVLRCSKLNFGIPDDLDPQHVNYDHRQLKWVGAIEEAQKSSEEGRVTQVVPASKNSTIVIGHVDECGAGQKPPFNESRKDYRPRGHWCLAETACDRIHRFDPALADALGSALRSQGWKPELGWQQGKTSTFEDDSESRIFDSSYSDIPNGHSSHINSTYASHADDGALESDEHVSADRDCCAEDSYDENSYDVHEVSDGDGDCDSADVWEEEDSGGASDGSYYPSDTWYE